MARVHITEAEAALDFHALLQRVREGAEIVIEQDHQPVALLRSLRGPGRPISECLAIARARESGVTLDEDFARELDELIATRQPLDVSVWE